MGQRNGGELQPSFGRTNIFEWLFWGQRLSVSDKCVDAWWSLVIVGSRARWGV